MKRFISVVLTLLVLCTMALPVFASEVDNTPADDVTSYTVEDTDETEEEEAVVSETSASGEAAAVKDGVMKTIEIMGKGMLGIFVVMIMIYVVIAVLGKLTGNKKES